MYFRNQPSTVFHKYTYPLYIKEFKKDPRIKYAYEDTSESTEKDIRVYQQLWGGLRGKLSPAYYFEDFYDQEEHPELLKEKNCFQIVHSNRQTYSFDDKTRCHFRFSEGNKALGYLPLVHTPVQLPSKYATFMWHYFNNFSKYDVRFSREKQKALCRIAYRLIVVDSQTNSMTLSPFIVNFKYLDVELKHSLIRTIASYVKLQRNLKHVVLENMQMNLSEGLQMLLLFALGAGKTIKTLNLWYYFKNGLLPLPNIDQVFCRHDIFTYSREEDISPTEAVRKDMWNNAVVKNDLCDIPSEKCPEYYKICLALFENVTELWIHYSWLAGNQGRSLCEIGSVKFSKLRMLHLLYNPLETVDKIEQRISRTAWKYVTNHVPLLEVSLTLVEIYNYNDVKKILMDNIPLVEFNMLGGMIFKDVPRYKPPWLDCIFRTLIHLYSRTLRKMSIQNWHPHQLMDVSIGKLLTKIPSLEEFEYQGHIDKSDTVDKICLYLKDNKTRLKRVHLIIQYDPCYPEPWTNYVEMVNKKYKDYLSTIGVDFVLKLYRS